MWIKRSEVPILLANIAYLAVFGGMSLARLNYEFIIYTLVIVVFLVLIAIGQRRVQFPPTVLWGLTLWGFLHMAGGHVPVGAGRLYDLVLVPLATRGDATILRYDHVVHALGFGVATLVCFHLLGPWLRERAGGRVVLSALVLLMGMGLGALNEVVELIVVLTAAESGVGGYFNTAFDLLFNFMGALAAVIYLNAAGRMPVGGPAATPEGRPEKP